MNLENFLSSDEFTSKMKYLLLANAETQGEVARDLAFMYGDLYESYKLLYNKANKQGDNFVLISQPNFTVSYIDDKPLFDGSDDTTEVFTVDTYQNYTLFETRQVPTSFLKDPAATSSSNDENNEPCD